MTEKERFQAPVVGDELKLRLFVYNSNNRANFAAIDSVEIYYLDPAEVSSSNTDGRRLVETIDSDDVTLEEDGQYSVTLTLSDSVYVIGNYVDVWKVQTEENFPITEIEHEFKIMPDLWFSSTIPPVYDFSFAFRPNRIRSGSVRWLIIDITPNVPHASDAIAYYTNLAIVSTVSISIKLSCAECPPEEEDLKLIVDEDAVEIRDGCVGYYLLDTTDMDCGIYDVFFTLELGEAVHISGSQQLEIYD